VERHHVKAKLLRVQGLRKRIHARSYSCMDVHSELQVLEISRHGSFLDASPRYTMLRQGSNALDSSSPPVRSSSVILSAAAEALSEAKGKDLAADRDSPFAEFPLSEVHGLRACP
jgi:hypothetical protein